MPCGGIATGWRYCGLVGLRDLLHGSPMRGEGPRKSVEDEAAGARFCVATWWRKERIRALLPGRWESPVHTANMHRLAVIGVLRLCP